MPTDARSAIKLVLRPSRPTSSSKRALVSRMRATVARERACRGLWRSAPAGTRLLIPPLRQRPSHQTALTPSSIYGSIYSHFDGGQMLVVDALQAAAREHAFSIPI